MMTIAIPTLLAHIYPFLHATDEFSAVFTSDAELTRCLADRVGDLAADFGLFVERDATFITLATGVQVYALPPRHLSTIHVAIGGKPLIASSTRELEARDRNFQTTAATALKPIRRFFEDKQGFNRVGFYPVPAAADAGTKVEIIFHRYPCEIADGIEAISTIGDYLEFKAIADQYRKESDFAMPEVAKSADAFASLYEAQFEYLWRAAQ